MSLTRVPLPVLDGGLVSYVGAPRFVFENATGQDAELRAISVTVAGAPNSGSLSVQFNRTGQPAFASVSVAQGTTAGFLDLTGAPLTIPAGERVDLEIVADGGATTLSGHLDVGDLALLATIDDVRAYGGIADNSADALIYRTLGACTQRFEGYTRNALALRTITNEGHWADGSPEHPLAFMSGHTLLRVNVDGTDEDLADYLIDDGMLQRSEPGILALAPRLSRVTVDYIAGFDPVPADLALLATEQASHWLNQSIYGDNRLGTQSKALESGGSTQYMGGELLLNVRRGLSLYADPQVL